MAPPAALGARPGRAAPGQEDAWVVLGFDCVDGRPPRRPWRPDELDRCLSTLTRVSEVLADVPPGLGLRPMHEDLPTLVTGWDAVARDRPDWPHLGEVRALARAFAHLEDAGHFVLGVHRRWWSAALWSWLSRRRGWR